MNAREKGMRRVFALTGSLILFIATLPAFAGATPSPYAAIDRHALQAPAEAEQSVAELARYLVQPAKSNKEKARAIYRWITDRIAYDADALFAGQSPDSAPEKVLTARKALCGGYANLFKALCLEAGVKAVLIQGKVKGHEYNEGKPATTTLHGWNAIKLDDDWYLVDATWGAGGLKDKKFVKNFDDFYFLPPPEALVFTHFPRKANCQLLEEPLSEEVFDRQPRVSARYFAVGLTPPAIRKTIEAKDFTGLVKIYEVPGKSFALKEAPLNGSLTAGARYNFVLETVDFPAVVLSSGGRSFALARNGKQLKGTLIAPRGKIKVQGLIGEGRKIIIWDLMEYEGK
jgi:hypothetical protein